MSYATIKNKITTLLQTVSGIGTVRDDVPFATDWESYLAQFKIGDVISVCYHSRVSSREDADNAESSDMVYITRSETWKIVVLYSYQDGISEDIFQGILDGVQAAFRLSKIGLSTVVSRSFPVNVLTSGLAMFGEVLCHKAELELKLERHISLS
jgi:hypothetical protein